MLAGRIGLPGNIAGEVVSFLRREAAVAAVAADGFEIEARDPDDIGILAEATAGHADVLVTEDRDLLEPAVHAGVRIRSPHADVARRRRHRAESSPSAGSTGGPTGVPLYPK